MASEWQPLVIPFVSGLDLKTDAKLVNPPSLAKCQNAVFTKHGTIKRRPGFSAVRPLDTVGNDITGGRGLTTHGRELLLQTNNTLYSYDALRQRYLSRGKLQHLVLEQKAVASTNSAQSFADVCTLSDVTVQAWEDSRGGVFVSAFNESTKAAYITEFQVSATGEAPLVVAYDGTIHVFFYDTAADDIKMVRIPVTGVAAGVQSTPVIVRSDANTTTGMFDVVGQGMYGYLVYLTDMSATAATVRLAAIDSSGGTAGITDLSSASDTVSLSVSSAGAYVHVAHAYGVSPAVTIELHSYNSSPSLSITTASNPISVDDFNRVTITTVGDTIWYFGEVPGAAIGSYIPYHIQYGAWNVATLVVTPEQTIRHSRLGSHAFTHDGQPYLNVIHETTFQTTYFLIRGSDGHMCGRSNYGLASAQPTRQRLPGVQALDANRYQWAARIKRRLDVSPNQKLSAAYTHDTATTQIINFDPSFQAVESGGSTYIPAGLLWQHDGNSPVESGFTLFPENVVVAGSSTGSALINTVQYNYRVYWEWTNAAGERERSAALQYAIYPIGSVFTPAFVVGDDSTLITVPTLWHTHKTDPRSEVALVIYRTEGNGTVFYRVSSTDPTATGANGWVNNDPTSDSTVAFLDSMSDDILVTKELDYQNTGELENIAPAAGSVIARSQSRLFIGGGTIPANTVFYSKSRTLGQPAGRFNENLSIRVDEEGGDVTGLAEMSGRVFVFKEDRVYAVDGEGATNLGIGGYNLAQLITTDVGCTKPETIAVTPIGLVFVSEKGIYRMDLNGTTTFIGARVETFPTNTIVSATTIPTQNIIVFMTSSGTTLVYDYFFDQWSTWTNQTAADAVLWNGQFVYLHSNGRTMFQDIALSTDDGVFYELRARTAPVRPVEAGVQSYWRFRAVQVLGEYLSSHKLHIDVYHDREDWPHQQAIFEPDNVLNLSTWGSGTWGSGIWGGMGTREYKFELGSNRQKCETISIEFFDTPGTEVGAGYELTELAFEWAPKANLGKISATRKI